MKNLLLLFTILGGYCLAGTTATAQCNAAFEWEQLPNSLTIHFINQSTSEHDIISYQWIFGDGHNGDGQNPNHTYEEPGVYNVCLIIHDSEGCVDDICHEVLVENNGGDNCEAFFEFEVNHNTHTVHFFNGSESEHDIVSYLWNFGDGHTGDGQNPIHVYEENGTYEVCLTIVSETGCEDTYCHAVTIEGSPGACEAFFEYDINQQNQTVHFFDASDSDHDIISWSWDFGDDHTGDGQNPVHEYEEPGTYLVCLTIVTETGCEDTYCHEVHIEGGGDFCEAFFEFEINQNTNTVHFFNGSESAHDIVSYLWNFGDGHTGDGQNPVHTYEQPGTYEVCLTIVSETGCEDTYCHAVVIEGNGEGCEAFFEYDINHETNVVHFFNGSQSEHDIIQYIWNFGDGHMGDGQNPEHHYEEDGTYVVCLTIVSETGCEDTYCTEIHLENNGDGCEASFTFDINHETNTVHFFDHSTSEHDIVQWHWNFGDGHTGDGQNPVHEYAEPGTYEVCLVIVSETGCEDQYCHAVVIGGGGNECHAAFVIHDTNHPLLFEFIDQSTSEHDIVSWVWLFGDGQTDSVQNVAHLYAEEGVYTVCLIITDETGCVSDVCHELNVGEENAPCEAHFEFEINQETNTVHFIDQSESDHDIVLWHWNFGDGQTSTEQNPVHVYENPGTYEVCLVIEDNTGCEDNYCHHVVITEPEPECDAEFYWIYNNDTDSLVFYNTSEGATDHTTWLWLFGDGSTSTEEHPQHEYEEEGLYTICLIMTDTTTDCVSDVCHTYYQEFPNEENNESQENEEPPANLTDGPVIRFTNPAVDKLHLEWTQKQDGETRIELLNLVGVPVMDQKLGVFEAGNAQSYIALPSIQPGLYTLVLHSNGSRITRQIMIAE